MGCSDTGGTFQSHPYSESFLPFKKTHTRLGVSPQENTFKLKTLHKLHKLHKTHPVSS